MTQTPINVRDVAVSALRDRSGNVSAHLDRLLDRDATDPRQRALARELALGAVRRRATLDAVLRAFLRIPDRRLPSPVREILHLALYQMLFLDRVPDFAAVNEAVEQTIRFRHRRQSGLVNGLLRTVARNVSEVTPGRPPMAADVIPLSPDAYRRTGRPILPDPAADPRSYLAAACSLPASLAGRWLERFGSLERAVAVASHANVRAPLIVRVNRLRAEPAAVLESLAADGVQAARHEGPWSIVLTDRTNVTRLAAFREGLIQPQDPSATAVCEAAGVTPGMNVLDFCAAPGTKTTHLAELMGNRGSITAVDISAGKLRQIEDNCRRLGVSIVRTLPAEKVGGLELLSFDVAVVDAPCSNTGVLARRAEARWRFDQDRLPALADDQYALTIAAAEFVRPGGRVVYSTCSIEPEECDAVVRRAARRLPRLTLQAETLTLPSGADDPTRWHDGGYYAILRVG